MGKLTNKVAVITGGSKGIGLETAKLFAQEGAKVVITGRDRDSLEKAKVSIPFEVLAVQGDVANLSDIDRLYSETADKYGKIDILFVNAGIAERVFVGEVSEEVFDRISNVNYKGAYFTVQKSLPYLNDKASIVLNASIAALVGIDHHTVYSSTKAAVIQLAKTFSADLVSRGIRVNAISPG